MFKIIGIIVLLSQTLQAQLTNSQFVFLKRIVEINSASENSQGLEALGQVVAQELSIRGLIAEKTEINDQNGVVHNVYRMRRINSDNQITILGHIDTVFKTTSEFRSIQISGSKIMGPGVIDMKGGLLLIRELLLGLPDQALDHLQILLNDDEETGSVYSKDTVRKFIPKGSSVLVFEPGLPDGSVVTSQSGVAWFELIVKGKAAHAGLEPEKGFNACTELSYKVTKVSELSDLEKGINLNPGIISGGTKPNVVCDHASSKIDVRFRDVRQLTDLSTRLKQITNQIYSRWRPQGFKPSMTLNQIAYLPPLTSNKTDFLFGLAKSLSPSIGVDPSNQHVGYGSDGNNISDLPVNILVGLGPFGGGMHTESEFMEMESFSSRYRLNFALIKKILNLK